MFTFKSNGTFTAKSTWVDFEDGERETTNIKGSYTFTERSNRLYMYYEGEDETDIFEASLQGKTLILVPFYDGQPDYSESMTFHRVD